MLTSRSQLLRLAALICLLSLVDLNAFASWRAATPQLFTGAQSLEKGSPEGEGLVFHSGDFNQDGVIDIGELLRIVQLYNADGYHCATEEEPMSEDGLATGPGDFESCTNNSDLPPRDGQIDGLELAFVTRLYDAGRYHPCDHFSGFCVAGLSIALSDYDVYEGGQFEMQIALRGIPNAPVTVTFPESPEFSIEPLVFPPDATSLEVRTILVQVADNDLKDGDRGAQFGPTATSDDYFFNEVKSIGVRIRDNDHIFSHAGDQNSDGKISLQELLRLVQYFNLGGYHCGDPEVGDGYIAGPGEEVFCDYHSSDYQPYNAPDFVIELAELLRFVQFFNMGGYHECDQSTIDGFCVGPPSP